MRTGWKHLALIGSLVGPVPLIISLTMARTEVLRYMSSVFLLGGTSVVSALLLLFWWRERCSAEGPTRARHAFLWAAAVLAALTGGVAFSSLIRGLSVELSNGETYALMPDVLMVCVVSAIQFLGAVVILLRAADVGALRRYGVPLVVLGVFAGAGVMVETMAPSSRVQHAVSGSEYPSEEMLSRVEGEVRELDVPKGSVLSVHPISSGMLWGLEDGAMAMDPQTGKELWRYRLPDDDPHPEAPVLVEVAPDLQTVVIEATRPTGPESTDFSTTRTTLETSSGRVLHRVEDDRSVLGERSLSPGADTSPVDGEGVVVQEVNGELAAFGSSSGAHLWTSTESAECPRDVSRSEVVSGITATEDHVFAAFRCLEAGGEEPDLMRSVVHAFAADTGEVLWTHEIKDAEHPTGGAFTVSSDGSLLYRYEQSSGAYAVLDAENGREVATGQWEEPRPAGDLWNQVVGDGVLLGEGPEVALTDAHGEPEHRLNLGSGALDEPFVATEEAFHLLEQPEDGTGPVMLTVNPWDGAEPAVHEDVLGRDLTAGESVYMSAVPSGLVVHSQVSGIVKSVVAIT